MICKLATNTFGKFNCFPFYLQLFFSNLNTYLINESNDLFVGLRFISAYVCRDVNTVNVVIPKLG